MPDRLTVPCTLRRSDAPPIPVKNVAVEFAPRIVRLPVVKVPIGRGAENSGPTPMILLSLIVTFPTVPTPTRLLGPNWAVFVETVIDPEMAPSTPRLPPLMTEVGPVYVLTA